MQGAVKTPFAVVVAAVNAASLAIFRTNNETQVESSIVVSKVIVAEVIPVT